MTSAGSVGGDDRLRLFLGLRLPDHALDTIEEWQRAHLRAMRAVPREHLHVTLAFLGHRPAQELPGILDALRAAATGVEGSLRLTPAGYRETRSVAMLVYDDEGGRAGLLAADVQERPGLRPDPPNRGTYVLIPSDASAYLSRLRPGGAQYEVLETVALGGLSGG